MRYDFSIEVGDVGVKSTAFVDEFEASLAV
jgi:hypothetical protein